MSNVSTLEQNAVIGGDGGDDLLNAACRQMALAVTYRVTEQVTRAMEERMQEGIRSMIDTANEAVHRAIQRMEANMKDMEYRVQEKIRGLEERIEQNYKTLHDEMTTKIKGVEGKISELEERLPSSPTQQREATSAQTEVRMEALEASLQKALGVMVPKVEALVVQLEGRPPPEAASFSSTASALPPLTPRSLSPFTLSRLGDDLLEAVKDGRVEVAEELLDKGTDVNHSDMGKRTSLYHAAQHSNAEMVSLLLRRGADIETTDHLGFTAMHCAACCDTSGRCLTLLIDRGARVHSRTNNGHTPLHLAARYSNEAAVRVLLASGADKTLKDIEKKTPLQWAKFDNIRRLLKR